MPFIRRYEDRVQRAVEGEPHREEANRAATPPLAAPSTRLGARDTPLGPLLPIYFLLTKESRRPRNFTKHHYIATVSLKVQSRAYGALLVPCRKGNHHRRLLHHNDC